MLSTKWTCVGALSGHTAFSLQWEMLTWAWKTFCQTCSATDTIVTPNQKGKAHMTHMHATSSAFLHTATRPHKRKRSNIGCLSRIGVPVTSSSSFYLPKLNSDYYWQESDRIHCACWFLYGSTILWLTHRDCRIFIVRALCSECVHTLDLGLSSHPKDVRVTSRK
jgi:hypothetical protein